MSLHRLRIGGTSLPLILVNSSMVWLHELQHIRLRRGHDGSMASGAWEVSRSQWRSSESSVFQTDTQWLLLLQQELLMCLPVSGQWFYPMVGYVMLFYHRVEPRTGCGGPLR